MNLLEQTKKLCKLYNITPARSRGQNFLINEEVYEKIVETAELKSVDVVLEVGPGLGFLTFKLATLVKQVIAVELDRKLSEALRAGLTSQRIKNVEVVNEDILTSPLTPLLIRRGELKGRGFKIVANLPYNITSIFLRKFLSAETKPELMVLMLQKEVAERIVAKPPKMSLLSLSVQFYATAEIISYVKKENFWPVPEVDSAIIKIIPHPSPLPLLASRERESKDFKIRNLTPFSHEAMNGRKVGIEGIDVDKEKDFFRMVKFGFSAKRKMLKNNLAAGYRISQNEAENKLKSININPKARAQELSVDDWLKLFGEFSKFVV